MKADTHPRAEGAAAPSFRARIISHLVGTVPKEIGICEFSCSATTCSLEHWNQCERRLAGTKEARAADEDDRA